jgi:putative FmdB family regulatory protein
VITWVWQRASCSSDIPHRWNAIRVVQKGHFPPRVGKWPCYFSIPAASCTRVKGTQRHQAGSDTEAKEAYVPTYDSSCRACDRRFEVHLSVQEHDAHQVQCPQCQSTAVEQVFTPFATVTSKKS